MLSMTIALNRIKPRKTPKCLNQTLLKKVTEFYIIFDAGFSITWIGSEQIKIIYHENNTELRESVRTFLFERTLRGH